ncbi:hypothetical protein niasHT_037947 [Heterodera trifolii]|uniref:Uncharacterized protein n=1 Tax=Heterodera trifolii TaxID=157864 RepID=A0ABD2HNE3_9BILA
MGQKCCFCATVGRLLLPFSVLFLLAFLLSEFASPAMAFPSVPRNFPNAADDHRQKRLMLHPSALTRRSLEKLVERIVASGYSPDGIIAIRPGKK